MPATHRRAISMLQARRAAPRCGKAADEGRSSFLPPSSMVGEAMTQRSYSSAFCAFSVRRRYDRRRASRAAPHVRRRRSTHRCRHPALCAARRRRRGRTDLFALRAADVVASGLPPRDHARERSASRRRVAAKLIASAHAVRRRRSCDRRRRHHRDHARMQNRPCRAWSFSGDGAGRRDALRALSGRGARKPRLAMTARLCWNVARAFFVRTAVDRESGIE